VAAKRKQHRPKMKSDICGNNEAHFRPFALWHQHFGRLDV